MERRLHVGYGSTRFPHRLVQLGNPADPVDGTARFVRALHSIEPATAGTEGVVLMDCSNGGIVAIRFRIDSPVGRWKHGIVPSVSVLAYGVPNKMAPIRYLHERISAIPQYLRKLSADPDSWACPYSVAAVARKSNRVVQGLNALFEEKIMDCGLRPPFLFIDHAIEIACSVARGLADEDDAALELVKLARQRRSLAA